MTTDNHIRHRVKGDETDETEFTDKDMHYAPDQAEGDFIRADADGWVRVPKSVNPTQLMADQGDGPQYYDGTQAITRDLWLADSVRIYLGANKTGFVGTDPAGAVISQLGVSKAIDVQPQQIHQSQQTPGAYWTADSQIHYEAPWDSGVDIPETANEIWVFEVKAPSPTPNITSGRRLLNFGATDTSNDQVFVSAPIHTQLLRLLSPIATPPTGVIAPDYAWLGRGKHLTVHDALNPAQSLPHFDFVEASSRLTIWDTEGTDDGTDDEYHNFVLHLFRDANRNLHIIGSDARERNAYAYNFTLTIYKMTASVGSITNAEIDERIAPFARATPVANSEINVNLLPDAVVLDSEFTAATVRKLLSLTADNINDFFADVSIAGQRITFTQHDGTTEIIDVPAGQLSDGRVTSGTFSATNNIMTLVVTNSGVTSNVTVDLSALDVTTDGSMLWLDHNPKASEGENRDSAANVVTGAFFFKSGGTWSQKFQTPSRVRILAPGAHPTKADYDAHAAQWTGRRLAPVIREVHGNHNAVYGFATFDSNPASATFGESPITAVASYADYERDLAGDVNVAWTWAAGQAVREGYLCVHANRYYRCLIGHTTATGNRPTAAGQTGWQRFIPPTVIDSANFVGIYPEVSVIPSVYDLPNKWAVLTYGGIARLVGWISGAWNPQSFNALNQFDGHLYADNEAAGAGVRGFVSNELHYFVIGGHLKQLTWLVTATAGTVSYPVDTRLNYPPVIEMWGRVMTSRFAPSGESTPYGQGNARYIGTRDILARWKDNPSKLYFGATNSLIHVLTEAEIAALVGADNRPDDNRIGIYFRLISGLWKATGMINANVSAGNYPQSRIIKLNSTGPDEIIGVTSTGGYSSNNLGSIGEPDLRYPTIFNADLLEIESDDVLYVSVSGTSFNTGAGLSCYMLWTHYGEQ